MATSNTSLHSPALGTLYLVPSPLDFGCTTQSPLTQVLPQHAMAVAANLRYWISENAKSTRAFLKRINEITPLASPLQELQIQELPHAIHKKGDHHGNFDASPLLAPLREGHDVGLISEAGMPAVADPGSSVVRTAHDLGAPIITLVGPASLLLALASSGLSGQSFAFVGYLPQDPAGRSARIRELESLALRTGQTQLFIETPYRNTALMQGLLQTLQPNTRLAVSSGLTLPDARTQSFLAKLWKHKQVLLDNQTPAVFAIGR